MITYPKWCPACGCNAAGPCWCSRDCRLHPNTRKTAATDTSRATSEPETDTSRANPQRRPRMITYTVTFDRIGRTHSVEPLTVEIDDRQHKHDQADDIAYLVNRYARPYLLSREVEVVVDLDAMIGGIYAGFQSGGAFSIKKEETK